MSRDQEVRAYKIRAIIRMDLFHVYRCKLQKTINRLWSSIYWEESCDFPVMPIVLKNDLTSILDAEERKELRKIKNEEDRELRRWLRAQWTTFHAHYVDCIIKDAKAILLSWYENYIGGRRTRKCPWIRSTWVRVKSTQYTVKGNRVRITIVPREKYLEFEIPENAWFRDRTEGWRLGEIILKPNEVILTYNKPKEKLKPKAYISIDVNKDTIDLLIVTKTKTLWIRINWRKLIRLNKLYQNIRSNIQSKLNHNKPKMKKLLRKYSKRRHSRTDDLLHKLAKFITKLARELNAPIIVEKLEKENMYSNSSNDHNKEIWMRPWRTLVQYLYKAPRVEPVDPRYTTIQCNNCGSRRTIVRNDTVHCRDCGKTFDRQLNACINIYTKYLALQLLKRRKKEKLRTLQTKIRKRMPETPTRPIVLTIDQIHSHSQAAKEILGLLK